MHGYIIEPERLTLPVQNCASERVIEKCGFVFSEIGKGEKFDGSVQYDVKVHTLHLDRHRR